MKRKSFLKVSFKVQVDLNSNTIFLYENKTILMYLNIQLLIIKKKKRTRTNIINLIINLNEIKNVLITVRLKSRVKSMASRKWKKKNTRAIEKGQDNLTRMKKGR